MKRNVPHSCYLTHTFVDTFNTIVTEIANEVLSKKQTTKKSWVTPDLPKLCDKRRDFKQVKYESDEEADMYRETDKQVKMGMLKTKEDWISVTILNRASK